MKTVSAFLLLISFLGHEQAFPFGLTSSVSDLDSLPMQQPDRSPSQKFQTYLPVARQSTTINHSRVNQSGTEPIKSGEIMLPLGIIGKSIVVKMGNIILEVDKDYTYLASGNRIHITEPRGLQSEYPIEITYETMRFRHQR